MAQVVENVDSRDLDLINKLRQLFAVARNQKRQRYDNWLRNYRLVNNRLGGQTVSSWMPQPRDSEIYPTLSAIAAWMTDQHTTIDITAASDPNNDYSVFIQKVAQDLATVMQTNWIVDSYERQVRMVIWDAMQYGAGIFKNVWDQSMSGGMGNVFLKRVDPWNFYVDPNATCTDDAEYFIEARKMSFDEVERRWPETAHLVAETSSAWGEGLDERPQQNETEITRMPKANPGSLPHGNQRYAAPSGRGPYDNIVNQGIVVYEFWIKENDEPTKAQSEDKTLTHVPTERPPDETPQLVTRWRVVVIAGNQVLMDEYADDLWSFGEHPYERYVFEENGEFYGIALVDHLAQPQIYINRLLTALQHNSELVGNPIFLEAANAGLDRVGIINKPGQRLRLTGTAAMQNKPDWLQPPSMPPSVMDLVKFWIERIENISGLSAAIKGGQGTGGASRTPEGVISTIQEAAFVRIRSALSNLEDTLKNCAEKLADLIVDNYDSPRVVAIVGPQGEKTALSLSARHFNAPTARGAMPLKYSILVQAGASMPTSRQARVAEADKAFSLGIIDRQAWFEAHQYPNWQNVLDRVNKAIAEGSFNPPGARQRRQK